MKTLLLSLLVATLAGIEPGAAQVWPLKPVRIVVPFGPGATLTRGVSWPSACRRSSTRLA